MTSPLVHPDGTWDSRIADWRSVGASGDAVADRPATIFFPAGVHTRTDRLLITSDDTVLRGEGRGITFLDFTKSLTDLLGADPNHSWNQGLVQAKGCKTITIRDLTIRFPVVPTAKHHLEAGWNGISVWGCTNVLIQNVDILNADSGILVEFGSSAVTLDGIRLSTARMGRDDGEWYGVFTGHHGFEFQRVTNCLLRDFDITQRFMHDISTENASWIVAAHGHALDLSLDHHKSDGTSFYLVDDVVSESLGRVWKSGGKASNPAHGGPGNVYYNIRKPDGTPLTTPPPWPSPGIIMETQRDVRPRSLFAFQRGEEPYPPTPPEEPPMAKFVVSDRVRTIDEAKIRQGAGTDKPQIGTQFAGALGTILSGPVVATGYTYYQVNFDAGTDGWLGEDKLEKVVSAPPLTARQRAEAKLGALGFLPDEIATI